MCTARSFHTKEVHEPAPPGGVPGAFGSISRVLAQHDAREQIAAVRRSSPGRALPRRARATGRRRHRSRPAGRRHASSRRLATPRGRRVAPSQPRSSKPVSGRAGRPVARAARGRLPRRRALRRGARRALARGCRSAPKATASPGTRIENGVLLGRPRDDDACGCFPADLPGEVASIERVASICPPPRPARASATGRQGQSPEIARHEGARERRYRLRCRDRERRPQPHGERDPRARRRDQQRRPARLDESLSTLHGVTSSRSCSIPGRADAGDVVEVVDRADGPWDVRQSTIFCAVTGPMPGSSSSWSTVAIARLTFAPATVPPTVAAVPVGPRRGTITCCPSARGAARLTADRSARRVGPPARVTASATREPSLNRKSPGRWTAPTTWTNSVGAAPAPAPAGPASRRASGAASSARGSRRAPRGASPRPRGGQRAGPQASRAASG